MSNKNLILYADDDADDRLLLEEAFGDLPAFQFVTFPNALNLISFLDELAEEAVHAVILDLNMPLMNGLEALRRIREKKIGKDLRIVIYSTSNMPWETKAVATYGAEFFTKPCNSAGLQKFVELINSGIACTCGQHK